MTRARRALKIEQEIERLVGFRDHAPIGTRRKIDGRISRLRTAALAASNATGEGSSLAPRREDRRCFEMKEGAQ